MLVAVIVHFIVEDCLDELQTSRSTDAHCLSSQISYLAFTLFTFPSWYWWYSLCHILKCTCLLQWSIYDSCWFQRISFLIRLLWAFQHRFSSRMNRCKLWRWDWLRSMSFVCAILGPVDFGMWLVPVTLRIFIDVCCIICLSFDAFTSFARS